MAESVIISTLSMTSAGFLLAGIIYFIMGIMNLFGRAGSNASATASASMGGISASASGASNAIERQMSEQNRRLNVESGLEKAVTQEESQEKHALIIILKDINLIAENIGKILGTRKETIFSRNNPKKAKLELEKRIGDVEINFKDFLTKERAERGNLKAEFDAISASLKEDGQYAKEEIAAIQKIQENIKTENDDINRINTELNTAFQQIAVFFGNNDPDHNKTFQSIKDSLTQLKLRIDELLTIISNKTQYQKILTKITQAKQK